MKQFLLFAMALSLSFTAYGKNYEKTQILLSEMQVVNFIKAQHPDLANVAKKIQMLANQGKDDQVTGIVNEIALRHGFSGYQELNNVAYSISMVTSGMDEQGNYTHMHDTLRESLAAVDGRNELSKIDKLQLKEELQFALRDPETMRANVPVVQKYYSAILESAQ